MLSENEDIERFVEFFDEEIKNDSLPNFPSYQKTKDKIQLLPDEKEEAEEALKKLKEDMTKQIVARREANTNFLDALAHKYENANGKKKLKSQSKEPRPSSKRAKK